MLRNWLCSLAMATLIARSAMAQSDTSALAITFTGEVVRYNSHISAASLVGNCGFGSIGDMTRDLFGRFIASSGGSSTTPAKLIVIDPASGAGTLLGTLNVNGEVRGLATFDDDTLLALVRTSSTSLYRVDLASLSATLVGATGLANLQALALDLRERVFAWDAGTTPTNGLGLVVLGSLGQAIDYNGAAGGDGSIQALALNATGALHGVRNSIAVISLATGTNSLLSGSTAFDIRGVAYERGMSLYDGALTLRSDGSVGRLNCSTGAHASIGSLGLTGFDALAKRTNPVRFIAARAVGAGTEFMEIEPDLVTATSLSVTTLTNVRAIAFNTVNQLFALVDNPTAADELWYLDPAFVPQQLIGTMNANSIRSLTGDYSGGLLGWDSFFGLVRVISGSGLFFDLAAASNGGSIEALTMDGLGHLVGANDSSVGTPRAYTIDVTSGAATQLGTSDVGDLRGIAAFGSPAFAKPNYYCTSQTNSAGCAPLMNTYGLIPPSLSHTTGFNVGAVQVLGNKAGILFYGRGRNSAPFLGGVLCVAPPVRRTPAQLSSSGAGCQGQFSLDFNAWIASGADPSFSAGDVIDAQWWSRDPAAPSTTNLTNAVEIEIAP